jgi:uncharacterized membrane protein
MCFWYKTKKNLSQFYFSQFFLRYFNSVCYNIFMDFSNDILMKIAVFIFGLLGLWVAWYVYHKKRKQQPLVCPIRFDCNSVINSDYSKFFGIPVEILGIVYYSVIAVSYLLLIFFPVVWPSFFVVGLVGVSLIAFAFSLYLIWVQIFALRKGCSWCFFSAFLCTLIFVFSFWAHGLFV